MCQLFPLSLLPCPNADLVVAEGTSMAGNGVSVTFICVLFAPLEWS